VSSYTYLLSSELISQAGRIDHAVLGLLISQPCLTTHLIQVIL
jgi:hypothetical protein